MQQQEAAANAKAAVARERMMRIMVMRVGFFEWFTPRTSGDGIEIKERLCVA